MFREFDIIVWACLASTHQNHAKAWDEYDMDTLNSKAHLFMLHTAFLTKKLVSPHNFSRYGSHMANQFSADFQIKHSQWTKEACN